MYHLTTMISFPSTRALLILVISHHQSVEGFSTISAPPHQEQLRPSLLLYSKPEEWSDNPAALARSSYSDNFLLNFHNQVQDEMQVVTNNLAVWNEELQNEQMRIIEWQDSFQRNFFADFTPPMSSGMNCLMVGGEGFGGENIKLPWEEEAEANVTSLYITDNLETTVDIMAASVQSPPPYQPSAPLAKTEPVLDSPVVINQSSRICFTDPTKAAAVYDCIVDQGLLDAVVELGDESAIRDLLLEAATAIREHGIYVFVARELSDETRKVLEDCSSLAGLEWSFALDGISDASQVVSVARRYCTGEMPKVGRLSRFQV